MRTWSWMWRPSSLRNSPGFFLSLGGHKSAGAAGQSVTCWELIVPGLWRWESRIKVWQGFSPGLSPWLADGCPSWLSHDLSLSDCLYATVLFLGQPN
jgi:hypothetical protein